MSGQGRRGQSRTSAPEAPLERYVEHTLRSEDASMNQLQQNHRGPQTRWRYLNDGSGYTDCYSSYPSATGVFRKVEGHDRTRSKLGAKTYDGTGDLKAGYLWLDRVSVLAIIW